MTKIYKNFKDVLKVSDVFSRFVPPMSKVNFDLLTENIRKDGYIRDPLVIWKKKNIILDGHHRYKIAELLDMTYKVKEMGFENEVDAQEWIADNQTGQRRLTKAQLAVFALNMIPMFEAIGKRKQSDGGKGLSSDKAAHISTELAAKKTGIGINMVKDIKAIYDNDITRPMVELIRCEKHEGLIVAEAKSLKKKFAESSLKELMDGDELSQAGEKALNLLRFPKTKTAAEKAVIKVEVSKEEINKLEAGTEAALKAEVFVEAAEKAAAEATAAEKVAEAATNKAAKKAATATATAAAKTATVAAAEVKKIVEKAEKTLSGGGGDEDGNRGSVLGDGVPKGNIDKLMEGDELKRYVQATKESIQLKFKGQVTCNAIMENPEKLVTEITNNISSGVKTEYHKDMVLIIPTDQTHAIWFQKASSLAAFFCDSSSQPVRFIYFGNRGKAYWNELSKQGLNCMGEQTIQALLGIEIPKLLESEKPIDYLLDTHEAVIETLTPPKGKAKTAFSMARKGSKAKMPTASELLKRAKTKKK